MSLYKNSLYKRHIEIYMYVCACIDILSRTVAAGT